MRERDASVRLGHKTLRTLDEEVIFLVSAWCLLGPLHLEFSSLPSATPGPSSTNNNKNNKEPDPEADGRERVLYRKSLSFRKRLMIFCVLTFLPLNIPRS